MAKTRNKTDKCTVVRVSERVERENGEKRHRQDSIHMEWCGKVLTPFKKCTISISETSELTHTMILAAWCVCVCNSEFSNVINYKIILRDESAAFWLFLIVCSPSIFGSSNLYAFCLYRLQIWSLCSLSLSLSRFPSIHSHFFLFHRTTYQPADPYIYMMYARLFVHIKRQFLFQTFSIFHRHRVRLCRCCSRRRHHRHLVLLIFVRHHHFRRKCTFRLTHLSFFSTSLDDGNLSYIFFLLVCVGPR